MIRQFVEWEQNSQFHLYYFWVNLRTEDNADRPYTYYYLYKYDWSLTLIWTLGNNICPVNFVTPIQEHVLGGLRTTSSFKFTWLCIFVENPIPCPSNCSPPTKIYHHICISCLFFVSSWNEIFVLACSNQYHRIT